MRAGRLGIVAGAIVVAVVGCNVVSGVALDVDDASAPTPEAGAPSEAGPKIDGAVSVDASPDVSRADATTTDGEAGDAGALQDASVDAAADVVDASDAGPPVPAVPPTVLATVPGLLDFDITDGKLATLAGTTISICDLPGCAARVPVPTATGKAGLFGMTSDRVVYYERTTTPVPPGPASQIDNAFTIAFDGTARTQVSNLQTVGVQNMVFASHLALGLTSTTYGGTWVRPADAGRRTLFATLPLGNPHRVGRTTASAHENVGAHVFYLPEQQKFLVEGNTTGAVTPPVLTVTDVNVALPPGVPVAIGTSERGPAVTYPTIVARIGAKLFACPAAADCLTWIDLGALGDVFTLDAESLYFGDARGLSKCALSEIATRGTCTPNRMLKDVLVEAPLLLRGPDVVWKSGTDVLSLPRSTALSCPPGEGRSVGGVCVACAAGSIPAYEPNVCEACPRGTYTDASGATRCMPCPDGTSTAASGSPTSAACLACPVGEVSSAETAHLCVPTPKRIFVTSEKHNGDLVGDGALPGANAIAKADAFCMQSAAKPATGTYKALLADGTNRSSRIDWPFAPSTRYALTDGRTTVTTTDATGALVFPLAGAWGPSLPAGEDTWTGLTGTAATHASTCGGWTIGSGSVGMAGRPSATTTAALSFAGAQCGLFRRLVCVEQ